MHGVPTPLLRLMVKKWLLMWSLSSNHSWRFRLMMDLDGDVITRCEPVLGYLHRGDEKIAENMTYNQFVPYTDRLDYLSPLANNVAYAIAVERVAGIELT